MDITGDTYGPLTSVVLGPLETEVMYLVWDLGEVTVRGVYQALLSRREIAYTTVMTIMSNLARKRVLNRRRQGRAYLYVPVLTKDQFVRARVSGIVDGILDRFAEPAMTYLVDRMAKVDPQKLAELEEAIAHLREKEKGLSND